jgi:hypothetical protein
MKKIGIIPPHFIFYLENENIELVDFRSSNFDLKENYDRMVVKFPYGVRTLDIQVIFDNLDYSSVPDFVLLQDGDFLIKYQEVIKDWNFRESSSLYVLLNRIKEFYSLEQERRLREQITLYKNEGMDINYDYHMNSFNIYEYVEKILNFIKNRFPSYKQIPKSSCFLDIVINKDGNNSGNNNFQVINEKNNAKINSSSTFNNNNNLVLSYPVDFLIRSRNINRSPVINIHIPLTYDMKFYVDVKIPYFVGNEGLRIAQEFVEISSFYDYLINYENIITSHFKDMRDRETVITKIIESNIGFPLEIDTMNFLKLSLFFHHNKNNATLIANSSLKLKNAASSMINPNALAPPAQVYNFVLHFIFSKDDNNKLEFQMIDYDKLTFTIKKKLDYGVNERDLGSLLHSVLQLVIECIQQKKK